MPLLSPRRSIISCRISFEAVDLDEVPLLLAQTLGKKVVKIVNMEFAKLENFGNSLK